MKLFVKQYLQILNQDLEGLNLTSIREEKDFYHKQILDSLLPLQRSSSFQKHLKDQLPIIDIGFGGGFPLLPLALEYADHQFVGFEAKKKKVIAVQFICERLKINNVKVFHKRFEEILFDRECCITFKAVGKISSLLAKFHSSKPLHVYFYKGPHLLEKEDLSMVAKNWTCIEKNKIEIPGLKGRIFLGFHSSNVPRGTFEDNLFKISSFL